MSCAPSRRAGVALRARTWARGEAQPAEGDGLQTLEDSRMEVKPERRKCSQKDETGLLHSTDWALDSESPARGRGRCSDAQIPCSIGTCNKPGYAMAVSVTYSSTPTGSHKSAVWALPRRVDRVGAMEASPPAGVKAVRYSDAGAMKSSALLDSGERAALAVRTVECMGKISGVEGGRNGALATYQQIDSDSKLSRCHGDS